MGVQLGRHVVDGAPGVQVGGLAHLQHLPVGRDRIPSMTRLGNTTLRLRIHGDGTLAAGGRAAPPALGLDQLAHGLPAVTDHLGGLADGGGNHLEVDDHDAQVVALHELLEDHGIAVAPGTADGPLQALRVADIDADPRPLLAPGRLDHDPLEPGQERLGLVQGLHPGLLRHPQARPAQHPMGDRLVVAAAHGDGGGQLAQGFPADDAPTPEHQGEIARGGIDHLDADAPPTGLVDDDGRVGVEVRLGRPTEEQGLVVGVLVLDGEDRDALEAQPLIQLDGLEVVVHHREIDEDAAPRLVELDDLADQVLADARIGGLGIDREGPEAGAVLRIVEGGRVVHAAHHAQDGTVLLVLRHPIGQDPGGALVPDEVRTRRNHAPARIEPLDGIGILPAVEEAHMEPLWPLQRGVVALCPEAEGVGGIQKQVLGGVGEHHVGVAEVERHVPLPGALLPQHLGQLAKVGEGLPEEEPPPAAIHHRGPTEIQIRPWSAVPALDRGGAASLQPVIGTFSHGSGPRLLRCNCIRGTRADQIPFSWSHSSRRATCQSLEPRSGVMCSSGAASSSST